METDIEENIMTTAEQLKAFHLANMHCIEALVCEAEHLCIDRCDDFSIGCELFAFRDSSTLMIRGDDIQTF